MLSLIMLKAYFFNFKKLFIELILFLLYTNIFVSPMAEMPQHSDIVAATENLCGHFLFTLTV